MSLQLPAVECATCYGRRFVRSADGRWSPCGVCFWAVVSQTYVKPIIRQGETALGDKWVAEEPWPLTDRMEVGDYQDFRGRVWRALLHYYTRRLTYDYFEGWRLTEIHFQREQTEYTHLRELKDLDLLVLVTGLADPPNSYTIPLVRYVTELRQMHGKPTWIYAKSRKDLRPSSPDRPAVQAADEALAAPPLKRRREPVW